jgi:hypothetical protein
VKLCIPNITPALSPAILSGHLPIVTVTMVWNERWFPWYRRTPLAPTVNDQQKGEEDLGGVHHERPRGKGQEQQDTLHTLKLPSDKDKAPLEYVFHHPPYEPSLASTH